MNKKHGRLAGLIIIGVWAVVTVYFAWLHTFVIKTCYLDEKITLDDRQYIIQEIDAVNFERVFPDNYNYWPLDVVKKLPVSLQMPFLKVAGFYSRPWIAYSDTWEVKIKGVAIPRLGLNNEDPKIYIDGHYGGRAVQQPDQADYSFFNTRGKYYSAGELGQSITLIIEDKGTGHKTETRLEPQWKNKYYFMGSPSDLGDDPADTARRFFALAAQGKRQEALKLVTPESRKEFPWPPYGEIWRQMNSEDVLNYSLERLENQNEGVIYALTIQGADGSEAFLMNLIKNQNRYEISDLK